MKLIDKDTSVAEINRLIAELVEKGKGTMFEQGRISAFEDAKLFLDTLEVKEVGVDLGDPKGDKSAKHIIDTKTLEVKEVDLDAEIAEWEESFKHCPASMGYKETAKHFFELGVNISNPITWEDIDWIVGEAVCRVKENNDKEQICKEVLKRFKSYKR